jgi:ADP-ribose pyrophosphatase
VGRPPASDEEADMTLRWFPLAEAVQMVFRGEIVNALAVAGVLAAHAVHTGAASTRPVDAPWTDRPSRFASRRR